MKLKLLELTAYILLFGSLGYIWITFGGIEQNVIPINQTIIRTGPAFILLGAAVLLINYLGEEDA